MNQALYAHMNNKRKMKKKKAGVGTKFYPNCGLFQSTTVLTKISSSSRHQVEKAPRILFDFGK
jgi:hypothetical protein